MASADHLRGGVNFPSGITAGGGDTGCDVMGQEVILTKRMTTTARTINMPKGTILIAKVLMPDHTSPSTTGDYAIDRVTGGANAELAASAAETPIITLTYTKKPRSFPRDLNQSATYSAVPPKSVFASAYGNATPRARTSVGKSSAFTTALIAV